MRKTGSRAPIQVGFPSMIPISHLFPRWVTRELPLTNLYVCMYLGEGEMGSGIRTRAGSQG